MIGVGNGIGIFVGWKVQESLPQPPSGNYYVTTTGSGGKKYYTTTSSPKYINNLLADISGDVLYSYDNETLVSTDMYDTRLNKYFITTQVNNL